jgi:hypothetical protein
MGKTLRNIILPCILAGSLLFSSCGLKNAAKEISNAIIGKDAYNQATDIIRNPEKYATGERSVDLIEKKGEIEKTPVEINLKDCLLNEKEQKYLPLAKKNLHPGLYWAGGEERMNPFIYKWDNCEIAIATYNDPRDRTYSIYLTVIQGDSIEDVWGEISDSHLSWETIPLWEHTFLIGENTMSYLEVWDSFSREKAIPFIDLLLNYQKRLDAKLMRMNPPIEENQEEYLRLLKRARNGYAKFLKEGGDPWDMEVLISPQGMDAFKRSIERIEDYNKKNSGKSSQTLLNRKNVEETPREQLEDLTKYFPKGKELEGVLLVPDRFFDEFDMSSNPEIAYDKETLLDWGEDPTICDGIGVAVYLIPSNKEYILPKNIEKVDEDVDAGKIDIGILHIIFSQYKNKYFKESLKEDIEKGKYDEYGNPLLFDENNNLIIGMVPEDVVTREQKSSYRNLLFHYIKRIDPELIWVDNEIANKKDYLSSLEKSLSFSND